MSQPDYGFFNIILDKIGLEKYAVFGVVFGVFNDVCTELKRSSNAHVPPAAASACSLARTNSRIAGTKANEDVCCTLGDLWSAM